MNIVGGKALPRGVEDMVVVVRVGWGEESERGGPLIGQRLTPPALPGVRRTREAIVRPSGAASSPGACTGRSCRVRRTRVHGEGQLLLVY